jgi:hypothetical protein
MKMITKLITKLITVAAFAMVIAGCSDGEMNLGSSQEFDISPPAPIIISFFAEPDHVAEGESTTISWEVAGADSIEITSVATGEPIDFHVESDELSGSVTASGLTSTTDFIITASKQAMMMEGEEEEAELAEAISISLNSDETSGQIKFGEEEEAPPPAPGISSVSQAITVTVDSLTDVTAEITADAVDVAAGTPTIIRWKVTPAEFVDVSVVADSNEEIAGTDQCDGDIASISAEGVVGNAPVVGCAVVQPTESTEYSIVAVSKDGGEAEASVKIRTSSVDVQAEIFVDGQANLGVKGFPSTVTVSWAATPAEAAVVVSSTPSADCKPALSEATSVGSAECIVTSGTKFSIVATLGEKTGNDSADVYNAGAGGSAGLLIPNQWAFEGEMVAVEVELDAATKSNPEIIEKLVVGTKEFTGEALSPLKSGSFKIKVSDVLVGSSGVPVSMVYGGGHEVNTRTVETVQLAFKNVDSGVKKVSSITFDEELGHRYTGVMMDGLNDGKARIYRDGGALADIDFMKPIQDAASGMLKDVLFANVAEYPATVAVREDSPDELFVGIPGAVMRSTDGGGSWEPVLVTIRQARRPYSGDGSHKTCGRDAVQPGAAPKIDGDIVSFNRICDIVALNNGVLIVATDTGIRTESNIDNDTLSWFGGLKDGAVTDPTQGFVVSDLEVVGDKIFAATEIGVFVSTDGKNWESFGGSETYAIAYDKNNDLIYAGAESGITKAAVSSDGAWESAGIDQPVISITVDKKHSSVGSTTIIASSVSGDTGSVQISRNGGTSWNEISLGNVANVDAISSVALASAEVPGGIEYRIALGSSTGSELFATKVVSAVNVSSSEEPVIDPADAPAEEEPVDEETE